MFMIRKLLFIALVLIAAGGVYAEDEGFSFGLDLGLGAQTFNEDGESITYQTLSLMPDIGIGKFGLGLDLTLNYRFDGGEDGSSFAVRRDDWIPGDEYGLLEIYLPKLRYVRWGFKGDPLYVKLGSIDDATLGTGFIMGNYANTLFLPEQRIFGMSLDVDGALFDFPYVGIESFAANLAHFDVIGGRLYARPLSGTSIPVVKNLQIGGTAVTDLDPFYHVTDKDLDGDGNDDTGTVLVYGGDLILPILTGKALSLSAFGDVVFQTDLEGGASHGEMVGVGGRIIGIITYGLQLRFLGENFIPTYFGPTYDLFRVENFTVASSDTTLIESSIGWYGSAGFSLLDDQLVFNASLDGPFGSVSPDPDSLFDDLHLRATLMVAEGLLPGFFFDASYDKKSIATFADLGDFTNAAIGANVNYKTGPAVLTLTYNLRYNPDYDPMDPDSKKWETTAGLKSSISLF